MEGGRYGRRNPTIGLVAAPAGVDNPDQVPPGTPGAGQAICRRCEGTGSAAGGACPDCGGSGKVTVPIGGA